MSRCRSKKVKKPSMEQLTIRRLTIEANNHQRDMCERREHYQKQLQKKNTTIQNLKEQCDALIDLVTVLSAKMDQHGIDYYAVTWERHDGDTYFEDDMEDDHEA